MNFLFSSSMSKSSSVSNGSGGLGAKTKSIHGQLSTGKGAQTAAGGAASMAGGGGIGIGGMLSLNGTAVGSLDHLFAAICGLLLHVYEVETTWPEIFVRAYIDDSLGERNWVDSASCRVFVDNVRTAFNTRPIPQNHQQQQSTSASTPTGSSTTDLANLFASDSAIVKFDDDQPNSVIIFANFLKEKETSILKKMILKKSVINRYAMNREQIKSVTLEMIKSYMSTAGPKSTLAPIAPIKRTATGAPVPAASAILDNKNFIRLLQNTCGLDHEVRVIALTRIEQWLLNPKLEAYAQDLLMAICCNLSCPLSTTAASSPVAFPTPVADAAFVQQIIKIKPKLKQHQHYFDCIRFELS